MAKASTKELHTTSKRMFLLLQYMVEKEQATSLSNALEKIGISEGNLHKLKTGTNKFTIEQIDAACQMTGFSADYIFGYTTAMLRKPSKKPIDMMREAMVAIESELKT